MPISVDVHIIEGSWNIYRFNPVARWSVDLTTTCNSIVEDIFNIIKKMDNTYLWSEFDKLVESDEVLVIE